MRTPSGQRAASVHARRKTQSPIGMIRPVSSASQMNSCGKTTPLCGWFQRNKASQQLMLLVLISRRGRGSQLELQGPARQRAGIHAGFKEPIIAPAVTLGAIKRQIGVLQQLTGLGA